MTVSAGAPPPLSGRVSWRAAVALAVVACAGFLTRHHWPAIETGTDRLAAADRGWLLSGAAASMATWACAALAQQGAVLRPLPAGRLVAAQFAASAANHVLPAGLGAGAVNLRFLIRCGLPAGRSASALAVKATAGAVIRGVLIVVLALTCPGVLRLRHVSVVMLALAVVVVVVMAALGSGRLRRVLRAALAEVRAVHEVPARAAALWGGSLAFAVLHASVLIAVTQALDLPLAPARVALAYLAASGAAVLLPTPGGLGSLDAALAVALALAGAPGSTAASAVLGYRLLTGWLPLVPGLVVLGVLVRRQVL